MRCPACHAANADGTESCARCGQYLGLQRRKIATLLVSSLQLLVLLGLCLAIQIPQALFSAVTPLFDKLFP
jgi:hypothetical protein